MPESILEIGARHIEEYLTGIRSRITEIREKILGRAPVEEGAGASQITLTGAVLERLRRGIIRGRAVTPASETSSSQYFMPEQLRRIRRGL